MISFDTDDEFEQYLKESTEQHRMFPSDKVWKNINRQLHTNRKWYGFWLGVMLLMSGAAVTWVMREYPVNNINEKITDNNIPAVKEIPPAGTQNNEDPVLQLLFGKNKKNTPTKKTGITGYIMGENTAVNGTAAPIKTLPAIIKREAVVIPIQQFVKPVFNNKVEPATYQEEKKAELLYTPLTPEMAFADESATLTIEEETGVDGPQLPAQVTTAIPADHNEVPDIFSAGPVYKAPKKQIEWEIGASPTISYRVLGKNDAFTDPGTGRRGFSEYFKNLITHKPDMGLQLGVMAKYPLTRHLKLIAGGQFNVSRYDIKAYKNDYEVATIELSSDAPIRTTATANNNNKIYSITNYRVTGGTYNTNWIKNLYYSISLPVGLEMSFAQNNKKTFSLQGTFQPSYIIVNKSYLLSNDLKNYANVPGLVRKTNFSSSLGAFGHFKIAHTQLKVGPQFRYQHLSSYASTYPVKENIFDVGLNIGITLKNKKTE